MTQGVSSSGHGTTNVGVSPAKDLCFPLVSALQEASGPAVG